jgi:hypothetical protein
MIHRKKYAARFVKRLFVPATVLCFASVANASPIELINNGNFETGTFAGWTNTTLAGSIAGSGIFIDAPGSTTPVSNHTTIGSAANGSFYAVSDQNGFGTHSLMQSFTVDPSVSVFLAFDLFANDYDTGPILNAAGLTHLMGPNQHVRVDILSNGSGAFDTGAAVLANFYLGVDAGADPHAFTSYLFDITSVVGGGGTFLLRFAEVDNQLFLNMGVDNVSIQADAVPEPATLLLFGTGLAAVARRRFRRS